MGKRDGVCEGCTKMLSGQVSSVGRRIAGMLDVAVGCTAAGSVTSALG